MNDELINSFKEYLTEFKQMDIPGKRAEIIQSVNEITAMFNMLAEEANIKLTYLKSNEVSELKEGHESEDDYLEALFVYIENAKSVLGEYLTKVMSK